MLRKRIIPIVLLDGFSVLKTINFDVRRNLGSPVTVIQTFNTRNVDELILLDIDASKQNRSIDKFTIAELARDCFMPLTVGGGVKTIEDIRGLLTSGADKIVLNSYALKNKEFIKEAAQEFGSQCIVVSVDVIMEEGIYRVYNNGQVYHNLNLTSWLSELEELGAGEVLLNNVTLDGSMSGGDVTLAETASIALSIPLIYSGGISSASNAAEIAQTEVSGVGIASLFYFTDETPKCCSCALKKAGVPAR